MRLLANKLVHPNINQYLSLKLIMGAYQNRRTFSELLTCQTVEQCHDILKTEIHEFFKARRELIVELVFSSINDKSFDGLKISDFINCLFLDELLVKGNKIINNQLQNRFKKSNPIRVSIETASIKNGFDAIKEWYKSKIKTLSIAEQSAKISSIALDNAFDGLITTEFVKKAFDKINVNDEILNFLGVDPQQEQLELLEGLMKRIDGLLTSIKIELTNTFQETVAEAFYNLHDQIIDNRLQEKIASLQDTLDFGVAS